MTDIGRYGVPELSNGPSPASFGPVWLVYGDSVELLPGCWVVTRRGDMQQLREEKTTVVIGRGLGGFLLTEVGYIASSSRYYRRATVTPTKPHIRTPKAIRT